MSLTLILSALRWLAGTKTGRIVALVLLSLAAFGAYTVYIEHRAVQAIEAKEKAAVVAESLRRLKVLADTRAAADAAEAKVAALQSTNEKLQNDIARHSAANDSKPCLDGDAVRRLRAIGRRSADH